MTPHDYFTIVSALASTVVLPFVTPILIMLWMVRNGGTTWNTLPPGGKERTLIVGWNWFWLQLIALAAFWYKNPAAALALMAFIVVSDFTYGRYMRRKCPNAPIYRKAHLE